MDLSTLYSGILIMVQQVRLIMFSLNMMVLFLNIEIGTDQVSYNSINPMSFNTPQIENDALASVHNRQPAGIP